VRYCRMANVWETITDPDHSLAAGLILGIMFEISFLISLFAITQRKPLTSGLKVLNWSLVLDSIAILTIGSIIWFYSLREPANYQRVWLKQTTQTQIALQDKVTIPPYHNLFTGITLTLRVPTQCQVAMLRLRQRYEYCVWWFLLWH